MSLHPIIAALAGLLVASAVPAAAQQLIPPADSTAARLRTTLRAFYYSLAHRDWEALSAHILPAKVVAHRAVPEGVLMASKRPARPETPAGSASAADDPAACAPSDAARVDQAVIREDGDWAEVSVPRCARLNGADEFRFVSFEGRWWIVYIDLAPE